MYPDTFVSGFSDAKETKKMVYQSLGNTGLKLSKLSFGGAAFGGIHCYGNYEKEEACKTLIDAIRCGINFIDTAPHYGLGEAETFLGTVLKQVPRSSYYISTKVGRFGNNFDFTFKGVFESFEKSLERLQLNNVDIVIIHDVEFADSLDIILNETLPAVEKFVKLRKANFIGISGYPLSLLLAIVKKSKIKIDCILTYSRNTLIDNTLQDYIPLFLKEGVGVMNAGCLGMRLLTNYGPPDWHPASKEIKEICHSASNYCEKNGVELGHLALYHAFNQPGSSTYIIGMNERKLLQSNLNILREGLNKKELQLLEILRDRFFSPNNKYHWEGIELQLYKQKKNKILNQPRGKS